MLTTENCSNNFEQVPFSFYLRQSFSRDLKCFTESVRKTVGISETSQKPCLLGQYLLPCVHPLQSCDESFWSQNNCFVYMDILPRTQLRVAKCTFITYQMHHNVIWIEWQQRCNYVSQIRLFSHKKEFFTGVKIKATFDSGLNGNPVMWVKKTEWVFKYPTVVCFASKTVSVYWLQLQWCTAGAFGFS